MQMLLAMKIPSMAMGLHKGELRAIRLPDLRSFGFHAASASLSPLSESVLREACQDEG